MYTYYTGIDMYLGVPRFHVIWILIRKRFKQNWGGPAPGYQKVVLEEKPHASKLPDKYKTMLSLVDFYNAFLLQSRLKYKTIIFKLSKIK